MKARFNAAEEQVAAGGAESLDVFSEDDERRCAERGATAQSEDDYRLARSSRVREAGLQRAGAGEQEASVHVQQRDFAAGEFGRRRGLDETPVLAAREPDHGQVEASWLTWSSSESPTPIPTAAVTGSNIVATNVAANPTCDGSPVRSTCRSARRAAS